MQLAGTRLASVPACSVPGPAPSVWARASGAVQLVLGVRPAEVLVGGAQPADFEAVVALREPLGDETIYDLRACEQMLQARVAPALRLGLQERVPMRIDRDAMRLFDRATEQAII